MTSEIQDITEAYIHLIHTKQYYTLLFDPIRMKQMYRIELISNTALITKSLLLNRNIEKLLFESLQTNLIR
jgi:hypothetical protein